MGWYFSKCSRSELIQELISPHDTERTSVKIIAHALRGDVLWSVVEITYKQSDAHSGHASGETARHIRCDLLDRQGDEWGHKPIVEAMHPFYYSCPLAFLSMAPVQCPGWREGVRAYHVRHRIPATPTRVLAFPCRRT